jgi:hypothetical protein
VRTRQVDTGAAGGTTYCYGVFAFDSSGNYSRAAHDRGVMIQAVVSAPRAVTGLTATVAGNDVVLNWHNPAQAGLASIAVRRGVGTDCPTGPADGTAIGGETIRASQIDTTAQPGVTYCYRVYALDSAGGASATGTDANVTTPKPAAPTHTPAAANSGASSSSSGWMNSTLTRTVAGIVVVMLLVMAAATAVTRRRSHTSAYVAPRDLSPRVAISGYPPVALVIPAILVLGTCAALVLILINL